MYASSPTGVGNNLFVRVSVVDSGEIKRIESDWTEEYDEVYNQIQQMCDAAVKYVNQKAGNGKYVSIGSLEQNFSGTLNDLGYI